MSAAPAGVCVDLGTGDGLFVYHIALQNPHRLCIGIDANARPLEKISERIYRKRSSGGAPNALYVLAAAETLPEELSGIADEITVLFPWGSLLRGVVTPDRMLLESLHRICKPGGALRIILSLDRIKDQGEMARLGLPNLTPTYIQSELPVRYGEAGFDMLSINALSEAAIATLDTSWAKKLRNNRDRVVYELIAARKGK